MMRETDLYNVLHKIYDSRNDGHFVENSQKITNQCVASHGGWVCEGGVDRDHRVLQGLAIRGSEVARNPSRPRRRKSRSNGFCG